MVKCEINLFESVLGQVYDDNARGKILVEAQAQAQAQ